MPDRRLRIYYGPEQVQPAAQPETERITVPLKDIFPLLTDAYRSRRAWLHDFADDSVTLSADLYDVLLAYRNYRRRTG